MKQSNTGPGRPPRTDKDNATAPSAEKGTLPGEKRKTYIVSNEAADKIHAISFWDQRTVKEIVHTAFSEYIERWEKNNGPVKLPGNK